MLSELDKLNYQVATEQQLIDALNYYLNTYIQIFTVGLENQEENEHKYLEHMDYIVNAEEIINPIDITTIFIDRLCNAKKTEMEVLEQMLKIGVFNKKLDLMRNNAEVLIESIKHNKSLFQLCCSIPELKEKIDFTYRQHLFLRVAIGSKNFKYAELLLRIAYQEQPEKLHENDDAVFKLSIEIIKEIHPLSNSYKKGMDFLQKLLYENHLDVTEKMMEYLPEDTNDIMRNMIEKKHLETSLHHQLINHKAGEKPKL